MIMDRQDFTLRGKFCFLFLPSLFSRGLIKTMLCDYGEKEKKENGESFFSPGHPPFFEEHKK